MLKNIVITFETLIIVAGIAWYFSYQHVVQQIFAGTNFGLLANQTRFLARVDARLENGETDYARKILKGTISANVLEMRTMFDSLDLTLKYPNQLSTAREASAMLDQVQIHEISELIEKKAIGNPGPANH
ncbi:MAG: hypothetical protein ABI227_08105 [Rhodanobacter sp.]